MPLFSVIIPTYNRAKLLREALESVFTQAFTDYEVIVVDDGSTDDTAKVVAELGQKVLFLSQPNQGPGSARTRGARNASGEYLAFLDSDDLWFPWTLQTYARAIHEQLGAGIVLGRVTRFSQASELESVGGGRYEGRLYSDFLKASRHRIFFGSGYVVIKRALLLNAGGLTSKIRVFEDQDLGLRVGTSGSCAVVESPVTVAYRQTSGSLTTITSLAVEGIHFLIHTERLGAYPGGAERRWERRNYIAFSIRSLSLGLNQPGRLREAWWLYRESFFWHLRLRRFRYLIGFWLISVRQLLRMKAAKTVRGR